MPFLEKCVELGIKNIHVHKGPTIWPLDKDAFDVNDVDDVATDYPELNFIVEHVGLPRIEDFCFMATQEPNVYAGLAVVIGGLMHARPRFFAKVMGELLFWVGEDKMLFGSDYAIWEPKWQVEGFVDWDIPIDEDFSDYPRAGRRRRKKKILGLNAAKLYGVEVPQEFQLPAEAGTPAGPRRRSWSRAQRDAARPGPRALGTVYDPELDEPITTLGFVGSCVVTGDGDVAVRLRLPTPQCAPNFAFLMAADARTAVRRLPEVARGRRSCSRTTTRAPRSTPRSRAAAGFDGAFPGETAGELDALRELFQRKALLARQARVCQALLADGASPRRSWRCA